MSRLCSQLRGLLAVGIIILADPQSARSQQELLSNEPWKQNGFAIRRFEISGTDSRNNPLRRALKKPFSADELFVRYRLRYDAQSIDTPEEDEGEFFVLWLDAAEGNASSTHSSGIPNIGLHVSGKENRFMVRYNAGGEKFGPQLVGDRDFLIVGRIWKSKPGNDEPFDQLDLWVDPQPTAENSPIASAKSRKSISQIRWIGFSTGAKTEMDDRIQVWDIDLATTWEGILRLPPKTESKSLKPIPVANRTVRFTEHVFPILKKHCFKCHSGDDATEGVRLDVLDEVLNQTTPRNSSTSHLFQLASQGKMPPETDHLSEKELSILKAWIDEGLDWDEALLPTPIPQSKHWAFQPIQRPEVPKVRNQQWVRTPVDAFIARRHEEIGLTPAPPAPDETLNRRISLDMLGLPSSGTEIEDPARNIDAVLKNPAYGERYARHWLDVARWAESNGHQHNRNRPYAWRYRDWVVNSFNSGKPFDDFLREQIAGDEITPIKNENLVATGFLAAARYSGNELDKDIQRNDILVDIVNTTAKAFLGLTIECAQCHSHKFDPISIRDYYRLQAFFSKGQPGNVVFSQNSLKARKLVEERWHIFDAVHDRLVSIKRKQGHLEPIYVIPKSVVAGMRKEEKSRFAQLEKQIASLEQSWSFYSISTGSPAAVVAPHDMRWPLPRDPAVLQNMQTVMLIRGDVKSRGPEVQPGWPTIFGPTPAAIGKPRTALANWMTDPQNPLTARVWVNRIWQWHFGRGLVETSSDFGTQGAKPTHLQLLDFLAAELIDHDWSTNHIHRLILNSATYRQSSGFSEEHKSIDPENRLLWRWTPRRLEAESIRDSILAVSGQLDRTLGGPSTSQTSSRRSIYLNQRRGSFPHQQMLFDSATGIVSCSRRRVSTTGLQPLWLLNSDFVQRASKKFAAKTESVKAAYLLAFGHEPSGAELSALNELATEFGLESACIAILNSSEFLYIP